MTEPSLDSILSGGGAPASSPEPITDEHSNVITEQVEGEPHPDEGKRPEPGERQPQDKKLDGAFKAVKEGVAKRYTEEVADLRKTIADNDARWEQRLTQLMQSQQRQAPQEAKPEVDPLDQFLTDPRAATTAAVQPLLEGVQRQMMAVAKDAARARYTPQRVSEAEQAFMAAVQSRTLDPAEYHRVINAPNRFVAAVKWHKGQSISSDPDAFRSKVEAEILAKYGITPDEGPAPAPQVRPAAPAPVLPSNFADARSAAGRSGPGWQGPPSLQDIFKR